MGVSVSSYFFFQAEDGIRDHCVTGVQTCALPICDPNPAAASERLRPLLGDGPGVSVERAGVSGRSEERRVGKECRSRRPAGDQRRKLHGKNIAGRRATGNGKQRLMKSYLRGGERG